VALKAANPYLPPWKKEASCAISEFTLNDNPESSATPQATPALTAPQKAPFNPDLKASLKEPPFNNVPVNPHAKPPTAPPIIMSTRLAPPVAKAATIETAIVTIGLIHFLIFLNKLLKKKPEGSVYFKGLFLT